VVLAVEVAATDEEFLEKFLSDFACGSILSSPDPLGTLGLSTLFLALSAFSRSTSENSRSEGMILLCLRLDPRTTWNWFVTFTPLWFFDVIIIIYVIIKFIRKWRNLTCLTDLLFLYKWNIAGVLLTISSQVMICLTLEYPQQIPIYVTIAPVVLLLSTAIFYVGSRLGKREGWIQ